MKMDPEPLASRQPITRELECFLSKPAESSFCTVRDQYSKRMAVAIDKLEQPISQLTSKIADIGLLVASTQDVVGRVLADAEKVSATVANLQLSVQGTAESMHGASEEFSRVPNHVKA